VVVVGRWGGGVVNCEGLNPVGKPVQTGRNRAGRAGGGGGGGAVSR